MYKAIIYALEQSELPQLELKVKSGDGDAVKIQQQLLDKLEKQMKEYRSQEDNQYELLETKVYTQDVFDRRNTALREKMELCQKQIYEAKQNMPNSIDYSERVATLRAAIDMLKDPNAIPEKQNRVLKSIIKKIEFTGIKRLGMTPKGTKNKNEFSVEVTLLI